MSLRSAACIETLGRFCSGGNSVSDSDRSGSTHSHQETKEFGGLPNGIDL